MEQIGDSDQAEDIPLRAATSNGALPKEDDVLSRSSERDGLSGGDEEEGEGRTGATGKKREKRYHRHTPQQIHEMEMLFRECPHPDEKQRLELSQRLRLAPRQVKFWFQNRRTQMKAQSERAENSLLRAENDRLRTEISALREALKRAACPKCGSALVPGGAAAGGAGGQGNRGQNQQQLQQQQQQQGPGGMGDSSANVVAAEVRRVLEENARLRGEVDRLAGLTNRPPNQPAVASHHSGFGPPSPASMAATLAAAPGGRGGAAGGHGFGPGFGFERQSNNRIPAGSAHMGSLTSDVAASVAAAGGGGGGGDDLGGRGFRGEHQLQEMLAMQRIGGGGGVGGGGVSALGAPSGGGPAPPPAAAGASGGGGLGGGVGDLFGGRGGGGIGGLSLAGLGAAMLGGGGPNGGLSTSEQDLVFDLALSAMQEVVQMAEMRDPLWIRCPLDGLSANRKRRRGRGGEHQHSLDSPTGSMGSGGINQSRGAEQGAGGGGEDKEWDEEELGPEVLNRDEYFRRFPNKIGNGPPNLTAEGSRAAGLVLMNAVALVEILLDPNKLSEMFPSVLSRAVTVDVISPGQGNSPGTSRDGALQLMYAETQVLSPLVPTREAFFLRFCKCISHPQNGDAMSGQNGAADSASADVAGSGACWVVSDVAVDSLRSDPPAVMLRCRRRPSGFVIKALPNGCSHVTVVEHVEADNRAVHPYFRPVVSSTYAFGASRWLATLQGQCLRLGALLGSLQTQDSGIISSQGRRSLMRLAHRMTSSFCLGVSSSTQHSWACLPPGVTAAAAAAAAALDAGEETAGEVGEVRVMTRKSFDNPGEPSGIILSAAMSFWLPVSPKKAFHFLRDGHNRSEWDILANGSDVTEMGTIPKGPDPSNSVSLLKVQAPSASHSNMLILQETSSDPTHSLVVYAPVDVPAMQSVIAGGDPDFVAILPSGFCILPDAACPEERAGLFSGGGSDVGVNGEVNSVMTSRGGRTGNRQQQQGEQEVVAEGSVITVAFQILISAFPQAKLSLDSVSTVNNLITCSVRRIRAALQNAV